MHWLELAVQAHPEAVESVSELLRRYATGGVSIEEPIELLDEGQEYRVLTGQPIKVRAYLPVDGKEEEVRQHIAEGLWHLSSLGPRFVGELQTRVVNEEDWANAWKDYYHVTHIGRRLLIRPSWRDYTPKDDEVVIELDPGMAFGTGLLTYRWRHHRRAPSRGRTTSSGCRLETGRPGDDRRLGHLDDAKMREELRAILAGFDTRSCVICIVCITCIACIRCICCQIPQP